MIASVTWLILRAKLIQRPSGERPMSSSPTTPAGGWLKSLRAPLAISSRMIRSLALPFGRSTK